MIREIVKSNNEEGLKFLTTKSERSNLKKDSQVYIDLIETAEAHKEECVGLAAVQIGEHKRAVVVLINDKFELFINPLIIGKSNDVYVVKEKCLSVNGSKVVTRYKYIDLLFTQRNGKSKKERFYGFIAQILQHEIDHCNGILI